MYFSKKDIEGLEKIKRLNIINSIAGIRPANLIGTAHNNVSNLAIFSSVMHLGSSPALLGFILRPEGEVVRNTYENIKANGVFTINHVPTDKTSESHLTSAKYPPNVSEFEECGFNEHWISGFEAPFVNESPLKIGLTHLQTIPIEVNGTSLVIGQVEHLMVDDGVITAEGYINLELINSAGVAGLNNYYQLKKMDTFPYARVKKS